MSGRGQKNVSVVAPEPTKVIKQKVKLLQRKLELVEDDLKKCCNSAYSALVSQTKLAVSQTLASDVLERKYALFLKNLEEAMDCDPYIHKGQLYKLTLEAWSCLYDMSRIEISLQSNQLELLSRKTEDDAVLGPVRNKLKELEKKSAVYNTSFAQCRVMSHIENGVYKPPKNANEQRKHKYKSFLALSGAHQTLKSVRDSLGADHLEMCLQSRNEDVNQVDLNTGAQPLHFASMNGKLKEMKILIDAHADVNAQTLRGFSALHFAYQFEHDKAVELLLEYGADVNLKSSMGKTPGQMRASPAVPAAPAKPFY